MLPNCEELLLKLEGGILHITLNRPHKRNAMNARLVHEIMDVFEHIEQDRSVRAVVLRGAEGHFCAGGDIAGMNDGVDDPEDADRAAWRFNRSFGHMITAVNRAPQVVITVLEGAVLGGGFGLACISDVAITATDAKFAMPETGLGIIPAQIAPFVVARIGLTQARRLALLGERIQGEEAFKLGICHYLCEDAAAIEHTLATVIDRVRRCAPEATAMTKALLLDVGVMEHEALLDKAADEFALALNSAEGQEGTLAFLEKRKPNWYGAS